MLLPSHMQLSATHHVQMVLVSVWPTTHAAVLLGTLGTHALNKVNYSTQLILQLYMYQLGFMSCTYKYWWVCIIYALLVDTQTQLISSDFQPCEVNVCQNGGTCTQSVDLVICDCPEGFSGKQCQTGNTQAHIA